MKWIVSLHDDFEEEFFAFSEEVQDAIAKRAILLEAYGSQLARPHVDTLYDSRHNNMKELRFQVGKEVWRVAFAFDPVREAILLVAGDKRGKDQKKFYKKLIKTADQRFSQHLAKLKT